MIGDWIVLWLVPAIAFACMLGVQLMRRNWTLAAVWGLAALLCFQQFDFAARLKSVNLYHIRFSSQLKHLEDRMEELSALLRPTQEDGRANLVPVDTAHKLADPHG